MQKLAIKGKIRTGLKTALIMSPSFISTGKWACRKSLFEEEAALSTMESAKALLKVNGNTILIEKGDEQVSIFFGAEDAPVWVPSKILFDGYKGRLIRLFVREDESAGRLLLGEDYVLALGIQKVQWSAPRSTEANVPAAFVGQDILIMPVDFDIEPALKVLSR